MGLKSATIRASDDRTNDLLSQFEVGTFITKSYRVIGRKYTLRLDEFISPKAIFIIFYNINTYLSFTDFKQYQTIRK